MATATSKSSPLDTFLDVKWKKVSEEERRYRKWRLSAWYDSGTWTVTLSWDVNPKYNSQLDVTGFGSTLKSALKDLEKQLGRVVGLMQP
jgi:hypothetical protein